MLEEQGISFRGAGTPEEDSMAEEITNKQESDYQQAGAAIATMYGSVTPAELSRYFTTLFPAYSTSRNWEEFKLGYMSKLWSGAEELASPVFVADTNPEEHRATDAVGFLTLAYVTTPGGELELLDQYSELGQ